MAEVHAAKRAAADLWLDRVAGVLAVGAGALADGTPAIVVSWSDEAGRPDLPDRFQGVPVSLQKLPGAIRPL